MAEKITWGSQFGFNDFVWSKPELYFNNSVVRVYTNWEFLTSKSHFPEITLSPTWQNFDYDGYLQKAKDENCTIILCLKESFTKVQSTDKWQPPTVPKTSLRNTPDGYKTVSKIAFNIAARWGVNENVPLEQIDIMNLPVDWSTTPQAISRGLGLVDFIEIGNEEDRDWDCPIGCWTPEEYFYYLSACYDGHKGSFGAGYGIINADPNMPVSTCGFVREGLPFAKEVIRLWEQVRGDSFPYYNRDTNTGIMFSFHQYQQGLPETDANTNKWIKQWQDFCEEHNTYFWIGEYGRNSKPVGNTFEDRYVVPILKKPDGTSYTGEESQGAMILRQFLLNTRYSRCLLNVFYEFEDQIVVVFSNMGIVKKDTYEPKDSYYIVGDFHTFLDEYWYDKTIKNQDDYILQYTNGVDYAHVMWSINQSSTIAYNSPTNSVTSLFKLSKDGADETVIPPGDTTITIGQMPIIIITNKPFNMSFQLQVINKKLNVFLTHFDSPESRLRNGYELALSAEIKELAKIGNCLTGTMRGDDVTDITPWKNNQVSQGIDTAKIAKWKGQILEWITERRKYNDDACFIAYLGERTNWDSLTDAQYFAFIDALAVAFKAGEDITGNMIWGWEEIGQSQSGATVASFVNKIAARIRSQMPKSLIMIHNNIGEKHWRTSMDIDLVCLQESSLSGFSSDAQDVVGNGYAVHCHEYYNPISSGSLTQAKKNIIDAYIQTSRSIVSGYGLYIQGYDTNQPSLANLDTQKYFSAAIGTISPPPIPTFEYDKIVILILENHSYNEIYGQAPYITSLADQGANFKFQNIYHPSQPNYLALFSGSNQGVTDNNNHGEFNAPNLAKSLIDKGLTCIFYSENLPSVGSQVDSSNGYARKHNPSAQFSNIPDIVNQPLLSIPTDFSQLPTVSFVVPTNVHSMHDNSVQSGDTWVQDNLGAYATWCKANNSLLIITFDESSDLPAAQELLTVIYGTNIAPKKYNINVNHFNLLKTIEDWYGLTAIGQSANANNLFSNITPPPSTNMIVGYSTKSDRSDFKEVVSGQSLPVGSYYFEARQATNPVLFTLKKGSTTLVNNKQENQAPYDLDGGTIRSFDSGDYELTVTDKANVSVVVSFTVGSTPPPPPPTDVVVNVPVTVKVTKQSDGGVKIEIPTITT